MKVGHCIRYYSFFVVTDDLVKYFFQDSLDEDDREDAINFIKCRITKRYKLNEMWSVINEIKQELAKLQIEEGYLDDFGLENPFIQEEYLLLVILFLIENELIDQYVSIWEKEYDSKFDFWRYYTENQYDWKINYIKDCISNDIISYDDNRGILALSYFLVRRDISEEFYKRYTGVFRNLREIQIIANRFMMRNVMCNV